MSELREAFRKIVAKEGYRYTPLYERLAVSIVENEFLLGLMDEAPVAERVPTLLFAALHHVVLAHPEEPLARWYPSVTGLAVPEEDPGEALAGLARRHEDAIRTIARTRTTQTNEVARSTCLQFGIVEASTQAGRPLALLELGCSAGLNLRFEEFHYDYAGLGSCGPEDSRVRLECAVRGEIRPPWPIVRPQIASRTGIDRNPIDVDDEESTRWLQACLFADQPERVRRLRHALEIARDHPVRLLKGDILDSLIAASESIPNDQHLTLLNSWVLFYFTPEERYRLVDLVTTIADTRDVTWLSAESPGTIPGLSEPAVPATGSPPTLLSMTTWTNRERRDRVLAKMHPHGTWIEWLEP